MQSCVVEHDMIKKKENFINWVVADQWGVTWFLVGHDTAKLIADKENILSPMETKWSSMCIFTQKYKLF